MMPPGWTIFHDGWGQLPLHIEERPADENGKSYSDNIEHYQKGQNS